MIKTIKYLFTDGIIKVILFSIIGLIILPLNIIDSFAFMLIILVLITVLSAIITPKVLKYDDNKFSGNFYLIFISNLIALIIFYGIKEFIINALLPLLLVSDNNQKIIEVHVEAENYLILLVSHILIINFFISLIGTGVISIYKLIQEKKNKSFN